MAPGTFTQKTYTVGKKRFIATANISLNEEVVKAGLLEDTFTMTSW